jgi:hypothetical protein
MTWKRRIAASRERPGAASFAARLTSTKRIASAPALLR